MERFGWQNQRQVGMLICSLFVIEHTMLMLEESFSSLFDDAYS